MERKHAVFVIHICPIEANKVVNTRYYVFATKGRERREGEG